MRIPDIYTKGKFELKFPFVAKPNVMYKVIGIREFSDLYIRGVDVYKQFYDAVGLRNGVEVNGSVFDFNVEAALKPVIITLEGTDDSIIYVPSTYMLSYPIEGDVKYSRVVLTADLGALPDSISIDSILEDVEELISARFGIVSTVKIARAYSDRQPSVLEHLILEDSRIGNITLSGNNYSEVIRLKESLSQASAKIQIMTKILVENNLI